MRPQLNSNYRHLCSPSNPVTRLLFGDDLPKAVKDISDTNRLSFNLTKDTSSTHSSRSCQQGTHWQAKRRYDGGRNHNNKPSKKLPEPPPLQKEAGGEEKERLNSNHNQVSLSTEKFAGRLRHFLPAWSSITTDQNILDTMQHYHLEIGNPNQSRPRPEIQFDPMKKILLTQKLLTSLFWVLLNLLYTLQMNTSPLCLCGKRKVANIA